MSDLLFDVPWWIPVVLVITGISLWVSGNRRQERRLRDGGAGVLVLAVGWAAMSYLVDTAKETCQKQTRQFVQAVVDRKWSTFDRLLDPDVRFAFTGSSWRIVGRDTLSQAVQADIGHIGLKTAHPAGVRATQDAGTVTVRTTVWSTQDSTMGQPLDSDWEFDWQQVGGKWLLHEIRAMRVSHVSPEEIRGSLPVR